MRTSSRLCVLRALFTSGVTSSVFAALALSAGCSSSPSPEVAASSSAVVVASGGTDAKELARVREYQNRYYADADIVHSFKTMYGEQIDCIDFYAQSSVKELLARGEAVSNALPPAGVGPEIPPSAAPFPFDGRLDEEGSARSCPAGTVPAHRPAVADIESFGGLDAYVAHASSVRSPSGAPGEQAQLDCYDDYTTGGPSYDHAAGYQYTGYQGLLTFTPVYNPYVENIATEHSVSQLWAETGSCEYDTARPPAENPCNSSDWVQSLELGWIVGNNAFSKAGGAQLPMLFTFVTLDGYYSENCWGMALNSYAPCPANGGFVQVSGANYVPGSYMPYTGTGTAPAEIALQVWNGSAKGYPYWYVYVNGNLIGYYPASMYGTGAQMGKSATYLQVGGEVFDSWPNGAHTSTWMGSGKRSGGWQEQAYHRNVSYIDATNAYHDASLSYVNGNTGLCGYEASDYYSLETNEAAGPVQGQWGTTFGQWNTYFYFGGPN